MNILVQKWIQSIKIIILVLVNLSSTGFDHEHNRHDRDDYITLTPYEGNPDACNNHNYDIHDPATGQVIMECREERLGFFTKMLRFTDWKRMTPFDVQIRTPDGQPIVTVKRGVSFFLSKVEVYNEQNQYIGGFKQKMFSIGGAFSVLDGSDNPICELKKTKNARFFTGLYTGCMEIKFLFFLTSLGV